MKNKTKLNLLLATVVFSALPAFAAMEEKICKMTCGDVAQAFAETRDSPKPNVLSCEQKGDIDADSLTLTKGTMTCQTSYVVGEGEMAIEKKITFTVSIKPEDTKAEETR
ncbi:MAG TPA: hypothetical protein ENJ33_02460 [Thiothrix sp.]|nr:hypothetical protein [Thiothrix sp.]